jgi:hypothetical protein
MHKAELALHNFCKEIHALSRVDILLLIRKYADCGIAGVLIKLGETAAQEVMRSRSQEILSKDKEIEGLKDCLQGQKEEIGELTQRNNFLDSELEAERA